MQWYLMQYIHELQVHFKVISILICNSDILIKIRKNTYIRHCIKCTYTLQTTGRRTATYRCGTLRSRIIPLRQTAVPPNAHTIHIVKYACVILIIKYRCRIRKQQKNMAIGAPCNFCPSTLSNSFTLS